MMTGAKGRGQFSLRGYQLYLMAIPAVIYFAIFHYGAMYGLQIAFKNFNPALGIWGSPWVGLDQFLRLFRNFNFKIILVNTFLLSFETLLVTFPIPIALALMLNQVRSSRFKKSFQLITYAPHFVSVIVVVGLLFSFLNPRTGIINYILKFFGQQPVFFMGDAGWFRPLYIMTDLWQSMGWNMVIYLAVLTNINPENIEAAVVDGATKMQRIRYIELPELMPTVVILLILAFGRVMSVGFEKVFLMQTPLNLDTSELISTYVYKTGLLNAQFSFSTAVGLFNSAINLVLLLTVNQISKGLKQDGIF